MPFTTCEKGRTGPTGQLFLGIFLLASTFCGLTRRRLQKNMYVASGGARRYSMAMSDYHEPAEELSPEDRDLHRALTSLKEEIEAIDWYHQRVVRTKDETLREVLKHNRDEEIEHATMTIEWLRRNMSGWDDILRRYLFTEGPIAEEEDGERATPARAATTDLRVGSLKKER